MAKEIVSVMLDVDVEALAEELAFNIPSDKLVDFVLVIDAHIAELSFTKELRDRLTQVIDECEAEL